MFELPEDLKKISAGKVMEARGTTGPARADQSEAAAGGQD